MISRVNNNISVNAKLCHWYSTLCTCGGWMEGGILKTIYRNHHQCCSLKPQKHCMPKTNADWVWVWHTLAITFSLRMSGIYETTQIRAIFQRSNYDCFLYLLIQLFHSVNIKNHGISPALSRQWRSAVECVKKENKSPNSDDNKES